MNSKGLIGLVIATAAVLVIAIVLAAHGGSSTRDLQSDATVLPELTRRANYIARLTLVHGESKTTLERKGNEWFVKGKGLGPGHGGGTGGMPGAGMPAPGQMPGSLPPGHPAVPPAGTPPPGPK